MIWLGLSGQPTLTTGASAWWRELTSTGHSWPWETALMHLVSIQTAVPAVPDIYSAAAVIVAIAIYAVAVPAVDVASFSIASAAGLTS